MHDRRRPHRDTFNGKAVHLFHSSEFIEAIEPSHKSKNGVWVVGAMLIPIALLVLFILPY